MSSIAHIRRDVLSQTVPAGEVVGRYLDRIEEHQDLGAFISVDREGALAQAQAIDRAIQSGCAPSGPLVGVPIAVKDNLCVRGLVATAGSRMLESFNAPYDATTVARLKAAGAIVLGKTNMDEFGMGSTNEHSGFGPARNPWDTSFVPGGSSGGSAAAVAAGLAPVALGSDTGGSVRQPAAFCGLLGLKPTYGRVSRNGLIAYASSFDTVGVLAHDAESAAAVLCSMAGFDPCDATSSRVPAPGMPSFPARDELGPRPLAGVRFGLVRETLGEGVQDCVIDAVRASVEHLAGLGAEIEELSLPSFASGLPAYYVIALSEASSNLARYDGVRYGARASRPELRDMVRTSRHAGLGAEVQRRILLGTFALSSSACDAFYAKAQQVRDVVVAELAEALARCDALISPTAPTLAPALGQHAHDPVAMYKGDIMTVNVNLAGIPAVTVPCGVGRHPGSDAVLPVGLQLLGRHFDEARLLNIAHVFQLTRPLGVACPGAAD